MFPFEIKLDGVNPKYLTQVEGVDGPFLAGRIGTREELPGGRVYIDKDVQFFFYTKYLKGDSGAYTVDIYHATRDYLAGPLPIIDEDVLRKVKENITILVLTRSAAFLEKPADWTPPSKFEKIIFTWGLK